MKKMVMIRVGLIGLGLMLVACSTPPQLSLSTNNVTTQQNFSKQSTPKKFAKKADAKRGSKVKANDATDNNADSTDDASYSTVANADAAADASAFASTISADDTDTDATDDDQSIQTSTEEITNGNIWNEIRSNMQVPDYSNYPEVQEDINWFRHNQKYLDRVINRSRVYIYYIYQQTKARGLPPELALIPIIESAYNPMAYSKTGASGLWQMMPGTASLLGIKINWWYDGRRDLTSSTKAALDYLTNLSKLFNNDWLLAIAAYDCGERAVQNAVANNYSMKQSTEFWALRLPHETQAYVPRFLALAAIVRDPARYGINLIPIDNSPYIQPVKVDSQIDLNQAAKLANISLQTLHQLNPGYLRWATDPDGSNTILIPSDKADLFKQRLDSLDSSNRVVWRIYKVRGNESLSEIAETFNTDSSAIRQVNLLGSNNIYPSERLLIPVNFHGDLESSTVKQGMYLAKANNLPPVATKAHFYIYKVRHGDTINSLAQRFRSTPSKIKAANKLQGNRMHIGQVIRIPSTYHAHAQQTAAYNENSHTTKRAAHLSTHATHTTKHSAVHHNVVHKSKNNTHHQKSAQVATTHAKAHATKSTGKTNHQAKKVTKSATHKTKKHRH